MPLRSAVISGGGTGIGKAVAEALLHDGYQVAILGRRDDVLDDAAASMADVGTVHPYAVDLSDADAVQRTLLQVAGDLGGRVDVIVANAGRGAARPGEDLASHRAVWTDAFTGNTLTAVMLVEGLRPHLSDTGRIIFISSAAAVGVGGGAYGAAKAALHGWMYDLAVELGPHGATANVVSPGFIDDTELFRNRLDDERRAGFVDRTLVKRVGRPADVADCVRWLADAATGYVTAQVIGIDGGALVDPG
ncbi:MAG: SDR family NAD(P)-dependent oxidoreductase [Ilumatobacter sp.]|nr:SDR family NAD(P)-dependent oxidoreductase [Ilumatobacter sp.]